jgi:hypothetical protein
MQITGMPTRLSSLHSHVAVGPLSSPTRTAHGALDLTNAATFALIITIVNTVAISTDFPEGFLGRHGDVN